MDHAKKIPPETFLFAFKHSSLIDEIGLKMIYSWFGPCTVNIIRNAGSGRPLFYGLFESNRKEVCESRFDKIEHALNYGHFILVDLLKSIKKLWVDRQSHPAVICN